MIQVYVLLVLMAVILALIILFAKHAQKAISTLIKQEFAKHVILNVLFANKMAALHVKLVSL